jgi:hypothetical protein
LGFRIKVLKPRLVGGVLYLPWTMPGAILQLREMG